jgi:uncharacterized membrane protein (UPF0127 family)
MDFVPRPVAVFAGRLYRMSGFAERSFLAGALPAVLAAIFIAMIGFVPVPPALAQAQPQTSGEFEPLDFVTASGTHRFSVEVMRTEAQRERGLMFRRYLPPDHGMLFDFKTEQPVMMWMKNTYLPLDMVFISRSGIVTSIAANAEPLSERIIPSGGPAYAVVELNAGTAARIGLKPGDHVVQALFKP